MVVVMVIMVGVLTLNFFLTNCSLMEHHETHQALKGSGIAVSPEKMSKKQITDFKPIQRNQKE